MNFLFTLGEELMKPTHASKTGSPRLPRSIRLTISEQLEVEVPHPQAADANQASGRCTICPRSSNDN